MVDEATIDRAVMLFDRLTPGHDIGGHIPVTSLADGSQDYRRQADGSHHLVWQR